MATIELCVLIRGRMAGTLRQNDLGAMSFEYRSGYDGPPLSISMPIANRTYRESVVRPYLFGLLPDDEGQRRAIASEYGIRPNNPVRMLEHIGLDCPGAVQFCHMDEDSIRAAISMPGTFEPLSDHDIAERLRALRRDDGDSWIAAGESWSLGGNQGKFALALKDGQWCSCKGSAPTTHIFKNGVVGMRLQALDEFVCMRTAARLGIATADVDFRSFDGEHALIVKRFDRYHAQGRIHRLHQEDVCQALSVMPNRKYTSEGGPTARDVQMLLGRIGGNIRLSLLFFTKQLFFNYLVGAPNAHAKNYSIILEKGDWSMLSPMYDVASSFPYVQSRGDVWRLAMSIGGENRFGRVGRGAIQRYAGSKDDSLRELMESATVGPDDSVELMSELAAAVPKAMEASFADVSWIKGADELHERMMPKVARNCETTLAQL